MSAKKAIADKCKDCIYDPLAGGTWRKQIEDCNAEDCPLWPYRPITAATKNARALEAYNNMTPEQKAKADAKAETARERFKRRRS